MPQQVNAIRSPVRTAGKCRSRRSRWSRHETDLSLHWQYFVSEGTTDAFWSRKLREV